MTVYQGTDLLDLTPERATSPDAQHVLRFGAVVDDVAGAFGVAWASRYQVWSSVFRYTCQTRAEIATLKTFLAARRGRYAPCWVPTWTADLTLTVVPNNITQALTITDPGPVARSLLGTRSARYVAVIPAGAGGIYGLIVVPLAIGAPHDNGDGTYTLRTDTVYAGPTLPIDRYRVSILKYARLDTDAVRIDYSARDAVRAVLSFVELPWETP